MFAALSGTPAGETGEEERRVAWPEALEKGGGLPCRGVDSAPLWQEAGGTEGVMCRWVC